MVKDGRSWVKNKGRREDLRFGWNIESSVGTVVLEKECYKTEYSPKKEIREKFWF